MTNMVWCYDKGEGGEGWGGWEESEDGWEKRWKGEGLWLQIVRGLFRNFTYRGEGGGEGWGLQHIFNFFIFLIFIYFTRYIPPPPLNVTL